MRTGIIILINLILLVVLTDALLFLNLRNFFPQRKIKNGFKLVFWLVPVFFILGFVLLFVKNSGNINEADYYRFTLMNGFFLAVYSPKIVYLVYVLVRRIIMRMVSIFSWNRNHEQVKRDNTNKITRAAFLGRMGALVAGAPFLTILYGMARGRFNFYIKPVTLKFKNLPEAFDGLKIIQVSDIHLGNFNKEYHRLHEVTGLINSENPDLIVMTGDMVNNFASETDGWETVFSKMKASMGKYSVLGNHDYGDYSRWTSQHAKRRNFDGILSAHKRFGFRLLRNESIELERAGEKITLAGVENWGKPPFPQYGDLTKTLHGVDDDQFKILLSHDPDHWDEEVKSKNVDLTLAGHTHGMQLGVKFRNATWSPAQWKYKYWDGAYREGQKYLYVNRGLGFVGIPMRVGMPPEITLFTLKSV